MPPKLRIPKRLVGPLVEFVSLPSAKLESFLKAVRERKPTLDLVEFARSVALELSVEPELVDHVIDLLTSLQIAREDFGVTASEFVSELRGAIERSEELNIRPLDWVAFEAAITESLSSDNALAVSSRAIDLIQDHARVFCSARVITDLRPVFGSLVAEGPVAFVVGHTLKIVHHDETGAHKEFYVALGVADIKRLSALLDRALEKEESLRTITPESGLNFLGVAP